MGTSTGIPRRGFLAGAGALAALALAGCSTSKDGSTAGGDGASGGGSGKPSGKITVMGKQDEVGKDTLKAFTNSTGITLEFVKPDPTTLNAMLAAGNAPDLVRGSGAADTPYIVYKGLAENLDDRFNKSQVLNPAGLSKVNDVWRFDGQKQGTGPRYGVVKDYSVDSMWWYRSDILHEAGVPEPTKDKPWSYPEMLEYAKKMVKHDGGRLARAGMYSVAPSLDSFLAMMATFGGSVFSSDLSTWDMSSPEAHRMVQWYIDVTDARVGYSELDPNPDGDDWAAFTGKRAPSVFYGYWATGMFSDPDAASVAKVAKMAPTCTFGPQKVSATFGATGYWMPKKAKNKDAAFSFLEFHCGGDDAKARTKQGWGVPAVTSLESELPTQQPYQKQAIELTRSELDHMQVLQYSPYAQLNAINSVLSKEFMPIMKGSKKADDYIKAITPQINDLLAQGK